MAAVMASPRARTTRRRRLVVGLGFLIGAVLTLPATSAAASAVPPVSLGMPVEQRYEHAGPNQVTTQMVTDPATAGTFALYYPVDLADRKHPVVTWGNGTGADPSNYDRLLRHLASWGFVVIDSTNTRTGDGIDILAGAQYVVRRNDVRGDEFHRRIDTTHIAAVGHSQGATGVLNATRLGDGLITTTVPVGLPTKASGAGLARFPADVSGLTGPVFYIAGGLDLVICPPSGIIDAYRRTSTPAAVATRRGAEHIFLPQAVTGYLTAWLRYQLTGDHAAASAFTGSAPELNRNPLWADQAEKDLPAVVDAAG